MKDRLMSLIDVSRLISLVQDLVRIPSVNPPGGEKSVAEYLLNLLNDWGVKARRIDEPDPLRPQVIAVLPGAGTHPPVILNGHMDVVPPGDLSQWTDDPFSGALRGGRIYGRGSCDMKGGLGVALEVARVLQLSGFQLAGDLVLTFAMGEEAGEPGTKTILEAARYKDGFGVVLEPTDLQVAVAEKGLAWLLVTLIGRPAHCSVAELGINPIEKFLTFGQKIREYDLELRGRVHPKCGPAKCTMSLLSAGTKENVVPESLSVLLDRRMNPGETAQGVQHEVERILEELAASDPDFSFKLQRTRLYESAEIDPSLPEVGLFCREVEEVTGKKAEIWGTPYSTDVRNLINDAGIPAVTFGPGEVNQPHTFNESIAVDDLVTAVHVLLGVAAELLLSK
jgi:succinyl-diaminopimelate desuccinylase